MNEKKLVENTIDALSGKKDFRLDTVPYEWSKTIGESIETLKEIKAELLEKFNLKEDYFFFCLRTRKLNNGSTAVYIAAYRKFFFLKHYLSHSDTKFKIPLWLYRPCKCWSDSSSSDMINDLSSCFKRKNRRESYEFAKKLEV